MDVSKCRTVVCHSIISVSEKGISAQIPNKTHQEYIVTANDKCVMHEPLKSADFVITKTDEGDLIVELKGSDVDTALAQVESTVKFWSEHKLFSGPKLAALIVCRQYPSSPSAQKAISKFKRKFGNRQLTVDTRTRGKPFSEYFLNEEDEA